MLVFPGTAIKFQQKCNEVYCLSAEIPSPSTTTRRGDASGPLVDAALEDDLFPATPTAQATSEPVTRYAELEDFSISSEDAGIQVYITFTQAEVRTSDVPIDHTPKSEVNVSQNTTNNVQEMFIYSEKDEIVNTPDLFDDTLEADLLPDVVASYVIPPFDYDTSNSSSLLTGNEAVPDLQENVDSHQTPNSLEYNHTEPPEYQYSETETPNQRAFDIGSFNPYKHWDLDSEEQERELLMQKFANEISGRDAVPKVDKTGTISQGKKSSGSTTGRSYLLLLAGNSTIVKLRQKDFAKYLKLNLAARLSLEYDDVRVNRVVLAPPRLLVNVSVVTPSAFASDSFDAVEQNAAEIDILKEDVPLHKLAQTNATLLELSGEEYHIVRLLPLFTDPVANDSSEDCVEGEAAAATSSVEVNSGHTERQAVVYTAVGGACVLAVLATVFVTVSRYLRITDFQWPWRSPKSFSATPWILPPTTVREGFHHYQPKVIYSGAFATGGMSSGLPMWKDEIRVPEKKADGMLPSPFSGDVLTSTFYSDVVQQSPRSKLHIFSCRPGSVIIPIAPTQSPRKGLSAAKPPLDVRIGVDNPNYEK